MNPTTWREVTHEEYVAAMRGPHTRGDSPSYMDDSPDELIVSYWNPRVPFGRVLRGEVFRYFLAEAD